jgi:hypothetical protein
MTTTDPGKPYIFMSISPPLHPLGLSVAARPLLRLLGERILSRYLGLQWPRLEDSMFGCPKTV